MTTKPYVSGAAYIDRMSDFCERCAFDPRKNCPFTRLYWAYLARHEAELRHLPRLKMPLVSLSRRSAAERRADAKAFEVVHSTLREGAMLEPDTPRRE